MPQNNFITFVFIVIGSCLVAVGFNGFMGYEEGAGNLIGLGAFCLAMATAVGFE